LSLAGGALSTHLDPDYRMQVRLMPHLSGDAKRGIAIFAVIVVGLPALVILPMIAKDIRESRWEPSSADSVGAIVFSRDQRILVSATSGPPWEATSTLWDLTGQARPRRPAVFEGRGPAPAAPGAGGWRVPGGGPPPRSRRTAPPWPPTRSAAGPRQPCGT